EVYVGLEARGQPCPEVHAVGIGGLRVAGTVEAAGTAVEGVKRSKVLIDERRLGPEQGLLRPRGGHRAESRREREQVAAPQASRLPGVAPSFPARAVRPPRPSRGPVPHSWPGTWRRRRSRSAPPACRRGPDTPRRR